MRKIILTALFFLGVFIVQAVDIPADWQELCNCRKPEGNLSCTGVWPESEPWNLIVKVKDSKTRIRLLLDGDNGLRASSLPEFGFEEEKLPQVRMSEQGEASWPHGGDQTTLLVKFREDFWSFYLSGRLWAIMPAPCQLPGTVYAKPLNGQPIFTAAKFQAVPHVSYKTDFMIEEGAENALYPWKPETGEWRIHTALEDAKVRPETDQGQLKRAPLTADKSPNFYSLKGKGAPGIITTGYAFYDNFHYTASIQSGNGEAGLVFAYQQTDDEAASASYYAFTMLVNGPRQEDREIRLWRFDGKNKHLLARGRVPLYDNQWFLLGVNFVEGRIDCCLDDVVVLQWRGATLASGKIGLYVDHPEERRFDDVELSSVSPLELRNVGDVRFNALKHTGQFFAERNLWKQGTASSAPKLEAVNNGKDEAFLVLGRYHHQNQVFAVTANCRLGNSVGLVAGYRQDGSHYRLEVSLADNCASYRIVQVDGGGKAQEIGSFSRQEFQEETQELKLLADASEKGSLRFYCNGVMLWKVDYDGSLWGGYGLWLGNHSSATFSDLSLTRRHDFIKELEQKNQIFQHDNYMRHWAAPEGQWIGCEIPEVKWHKGDFLGDFTLRLPLPENGQLHLAVPEEAKDGTVVLSMGAQGNWKLQVHDAAGPDGSSVYEGTIPPVEGQGAPMLEIVHEGYWLWLKDGDKVLVAHRLPERLKHYGRRALVKNVGLDMLAKSKVTRVNVVDEFFNDSPHAWHAVGGDWQIINRFQCTPSWSHMICTAIDCLGSFWRKQIFSGDMTLEFYAGTRHGYYNLAGNLNCTILSPETSPSSGYTVTCTEWDHNASQKWTRLYQNGQEICSTDIYTVPRNRNGQMRKITNPLLHKDRPIHGAWYYIKLRKIGRLLEYYFDDELLMRQEVNQDVEEGLVGIWTFFHSMTLAQIKITSEGIRPRPIPVTPLPLDDSSRPKSVADGHKWEETIGGFPANSLNLAYWKTTDNVGQSRLENHGGNADELFLTNPLGGGALQATASLPKLRMDQIAGWVCSVCCTDTAKFNAFYADAKRTGKFFLQMTGDDYSLADWKLTGRRSLVPGWLQKDGNIKGWQEVRILHPSYQRDNSGDKELELLGFGLEQPDLMAAGINGNVPGDGYGISELRPIFYGVPNVVLGTGTRLFARWPWNKTFWDATPELVMQRMKENSREGWNEISLLFRNGRENLTQKVTWLKLPDKPKFTLSWDRRAPDTLCLVPETDYPDPRFAGATLKIGDLTLQPQTPIPPDDTAHYEEILRFCLPPNPTVQKAFAEGKLNVTVNLTSGAEQLELAVNGRRLNGGPTLLGLDGFRGYLQTFAKGDDKAVRKNDVTVERLYDDSEQGCFLQVFNNRPWQRLHFGIPCATSFAQTPLVQMRYRASDQADVSLRAKYPNHSRLTELDSQNTASVRLGTNMLQDNALRDWRSWLGYASDSFLGTGLDYDRYEVKELEFASFSNHDMTGFHSILQLDDLVCGPAVKDASALSFTPQYFDADGVAKVRFALHQGSSPWDDLDAQDRAELVWQEAAPETRIVPDVAQLPDGVHHLFLQGIDTQDEQSAVTDIPFLLDRQPLELPAPKMVDIDNPVSGGKFYEVSIKNGDGAPWNPRTVKFTLDGQELKLKEWGCIHRHAGATDTFDINVPLLLYTQLLTAPNGSTINLQMEHIEDGAGNVVDKLPLPVKVDFASDTQGPKWLRLKQPASCSFLRHWDGMASATRGVSAFIANTRGGVDTPADGQSPRLLVQANNQGKSVVEFKTEWKVSERPYLSFMMCVPARRDKQRTFVELVFDDKVGDNVTRIIGIDAPSGRDQLELNTATSYDRAAGKWLRYDFDVRQMLNAKDVSAETLSARTVVRLRFYVENVSHNDAMLLDNIWIYGPVGQDDKLSWSGVDISGIDSLECTALAPDDKELWTESLAADKPVEMAALVAKVQGFQWLRLRIKDRAGNFSTPCLIPLHGE